MYPFPNFGISINDKAMKTLARISAILVMVLATAFNAAAQGVTISTYVEQTKTSPKLGYMLGYTFDSEIAIEVGLFYHNELPGYDHILAESYMKRRETQFAGFYFGYPAINTEKFDLIIQIRTGVVNNENFVITPTIEGRYKASKRIYVGAGLGTRCFSPTALGKVGWTF